MQTTHTNTLKRMLTLALMVITVTLFSGCFDLGKFEDVEDYYSSLGNVTLINQNVSDNAKEYSFKEYFYNEESVNNFGGKIVDQDEYIYLILPVEKGFNLVGFSLYLKSNVNEKVYFSLFISDFIPDKIRKYADPKTEEKQNENVTNNGEESSTTEEEIQYNDLPIENSIYQGGVDLIPSKWISFTAKVADRHSNNAKKCFVQKGEYIIVRFENNSGLGFDKGYSKVSFSLTNILIEAL